MLLDFLGRFGAGFVGRGVAVSPCTHPRFASQGGELWFLLYESNLLPHTHIGGLGCDAVRFYTANVMVALTHIHNRGYKYRDLKPENLLIDRLGYVKVCPKFSANGRCWWTVSSVVVQVITTASMGCTLNCCLILVVR